MIFGDARDLLDQLEEALKETLDEEESRLQAEVDFLRNVQDGVGSATVEESSTELSDFYLTGLLSNYFPISE